MNLIARFARGRFHYGWVVAAITFLTLLAAAGVRAAPNVLMVPVGNAFQWSRAAVSAAVAVNLMLYGLMGPFAAALYARFGLRRSMTLAMALLSFGFGGTVLIHHYWQLVLLWGVCVGAGSGMAATVLGASVSSRWFTQCRGLVMGMLTASGATGQLVFLPLLASLIEAHGWKAAPLVTASVATALIPLIWFLMRDDPRDLGLLPYGENSSAPAKPPQAIGNPLRLAFATLREATRKRDFWLLAGSFFICGASTNGLVGTHLVSAAFDCGIPEVRATGLVAMMGIFDLVGTTLSGWLSDRLNNRWLLFGYYGLRGLSLLFLPTALAGPQTGLSIFAVVYGLDWVATVPPTVRLTADVFGAERAPIVFGWIAASHQLGAAFAALCAGTLRTALGDYTVAFLAAGGLCVVAALGVLQIHRRKSGVLPAGAAAAS